MMSVSQRVIALHRSGLPPKAIAEDVGRSLSWVYTILGQAGIKPNRPPQGRPSGVGYVDALIRKRAAAVERAFEKHRRAVAAHSEAVARRDALIAGGTDAR